MTAVIEGLTRVRFTGPNGQSITVSTDKARAMLSAIGRSPDTCDLLLMVVAMRGTTNLPSRDGNVRLDRIA